MKKNFLFPTLILIFFCQISQAQDADLVPTITPVDNHNNIISNKEITFTKNNIVIVNPGVQKIIFQFVDTAAIEFLVKLSRTDTTASWNSFTGGTLFLTLEENQIYEVLFREKNKYTNTTHYIIDAKAFWWKRTEFVALIIALFGLFIISTVFYLFRRKKKNELRKKEYEKNQAKYELKAMYAQLNPHFVFNALSSIQGLINKNDIPGANYYLTEFSNLLRETLKNNDKELVPLQTELKILDTYLKLEQLRFHFQYEIIIDEKIDKNSVEIPALLLQPLIENAVKHGISTLHDNGTIKINFFSDHQNLQIIIWDNGIGFTKNTTGNGLGLKLTKDRIALLNQSFRKQHIQFSIESTQNTGTTVHLRFVNWL